jgi:hypothetical protein
MSLCLERLRAAALLALGLCGAAGFGGVGCVQQQQAAPLPEPMEIDPAMQRRDWERSVAWYPNGDTVAGVNRFPIRSQGGNPGDPDYNNAMLDLLATAAQTVALPFTYLFVPPFEPQVFSGEYIPPTYTAMPDMRPVMETPEGPVTIKRAEELERLESPEPLPRPPEQRRRDRDIRRGPIGPGDSDFMSSPPTPAEDFE